MSFSTIFSNLYANTYLYANGESIWKNVSANTLTTSGNAIIGGNATVQGNLIVVGNIYRQEEINIANTVIIVAGNANTPSEASGAGIQVGNANYASFLWNSNANTWYTGSSNISAGYFLGNGSQLTGLDFTNYSNSNAAAYLASNAAITILTTGNITSAANIQGAYLLGNISSATGGYSNTDVAAYLPTYTGNLASLAGNVVTSANVQGAFILGNGAFLTGIAGTYGNADVANYLASNANLQITTQGNVTGNYFIGNGALLTGVGTSSYSNANVANYLVSINNVTIGTNAGNSNQGNRSVAIGYLAATGIDGNANAGQSIDAVAIGSEAGRYGQGSEAVAIGDSAGQTDQQFGAIAIGSGAASLRQKNGAVAIGEQAGAGDQNTYAVAIGSQSGLSSQGYAAIAIGRRAGQVNQPNNSIILNATGVTLSGSNANALYIDPIRNDTGIGNVLFYNVDTKEITFAPEYNDISVAEYLQVYDGNALFGNITVTRDAVIQGNLRVQGNTTYINVDDLVIDDYLIIVGNAATQLSDLNGAGLQIGNLANGNIQFVYNSTSNVMTLNVGANIANVLNVEGNVTATGNVQGSYVLGNGAFLTGLAATYSNANVAAYLASNANIAITTQGNITATYFIGDGSQIANLPLGNYSNSNVAAYLPTYTGNLTSLTGNVTTTANVQGAYILGNGAFLSGISGTGNYSNANVAAYLPNYQGLISNIEFRSTSPAAAAIIVNDRSLTIGGNLYSYIILPDDGNANSVAAELTNHGLGNVIISSGPADYEWVFDNAGNLFAPGNIDAGNVVSANYFIGNGALLTGIAGANLGNITITAANISTNIANGNVGISGNGSGHVLLSNVLPWNANTGPANNAVDLGSAAYQFRDLYVGNVITPAGNQGNATQIQPASGVGESGVAFIDAISGSPADVSAGILYIETVNATGNITVDTYIEANELISLANLTVGDNANIANGIKVGGYANFLGNLRAENIAAVTNIEAQFFYGNGYYLTGLNAANLIGAYSNANVANYLPTYNGNILAGNLTVSNNVIIQGNLQVLGNTTTIEANSLIISDKDITVANGALNASQANGAGIIVGASNIANIIYLSTPNYWSLYPGVYTAGNVTAEGNVNATGNINANNATIGNILTANTGNFTCCLQIGGATTTYFNAYTTSNAADQVLYQANVDLSAQLDFNIIATDPTLLGGSRQSSKILSTTYGNSTDFVEYGGVYINTPVGDFSVDQSSGNVRLLVTPQTNANIAYSVLVTRLL